MLTPAPKFGIAMRNATRHPEMPDAADLIVYAVEMEALGFESIWAFDHFLLGVEPSFPIHEALLILTAIAARTTRIGIGTGALVLPRRNPVVVAKELATLDHISSGRLIVGAAVGWYKREFDALGLDFHQRGRLMDEALEIITRLWTEPRVDASFPPYNLRGAVLYPKPLQQPRPPLLIGGYAEAALKRAATKGDGWLTAFATPQHVARSLARVHAHAEAAGRDPKRLHATNQVPIGIGPRAAMEPAMKAWLQSEWAYASWTDTMLESAILGPPEACARAIEAHLAAGAERLIFVPYRYDREQATMLAREVLPMVRSGAR